MMAARVHLDLHATLGISEGTLLSKAVSTMYIFLKSAVTFNHFIIEQQ